MLRVREPGLCARLAAWREIDGVFEVITFDARGRLWLWRTAWSRHVDERGERRHGQGWTGVTELLVPVFGPLAPAARRIGIEWDMRDAINQFEPEEDHEGEG